MAKKRFTFADAKQRIKDLEEQIEALNVDTSDNVYTTEENNVINSEITFSKLNISYTSC